jgi:hypothetical protein
MEKYMEKQARKQRQVGDPDDCNGDLVERVAVLLREGRIAGVSEEELLAITQLFDLPPVRLCLVQLDRLFNDGRFGLESVNARVEFYEKDGLHLMRLVPCNRPKKEPDHE